jgi:hypothetical protein
MRIKRGGSSERVPTTAKLPELVHPPPTANPAEINKQILEAAAAQQIANKTLAGGRKKQRGGACVGGTLSQADGYGYMAPSNCLEVPSFRDSGTQALATQGTLINATAVANAVNDNKIGQN